MCSDFETDLNTGDAIESNIFDMECPPRSGKTARFPEIDCVAWLDSETAKHDSRCNQLSNVNSSHRLV